MSTRVENDRVAFVVGAGHSGSTLLGLMLGAHPQVFYAGEARKSLFLDEPRKPLRKRVCKLCGPDCVVWGTLRPAAHPDRDLYDLLSERTGRPVVMDSTKNAAWVEENAPKVRARGGRTHLFFLQRDGRAVVNSRLRKYPETSAREHTLEWKAQIEASQAFAARFEGPVLEVRYEALASRTEHELARAATFLGLNFEAAMLTPWLAEQHPLGGNSGTQSLIAREIPKPGSMVELSARNRDYYAAHPRAIVLDERWRTEMTREALAAFEDLAGETNQPFAWETP